MRVHGVPAHSGTPHLGENAIYRAGELLGLIAEHHEKVVRHRTHPLVGAASLTVTRMNGGHADNVLPGDCDLLLDRRMVPGEDEEAVKREIGDLLALARERFGMRAEIVDYKATTGGATRDADRHARSCRRASRRAAPMVLPSQARSASRGLATSCIFAGIGAEGTVIGPGDLAVAHKPDEFVPVDEFIAASLIYRDVALAMLRNGRLRRACLPACRRICIIAAASCCTRLRRAASRISTEIYLRLDDGETVGIGEVRANIAYLNGFASKTVMACGDRGCRRRRLGARSGRICCATMPEWARALDRARAHADRLRAARSRGACAGMLSVAAWIGGDAAERVMSPNQPDAILVVG